MQTTIAIEFCLLMQSDRILDSLNWQKNIEYSNFLKQKRKKRKIVLQADTVSDKLINLLDYIR